MVTETTNNEKGSSATAKTALGIGIGALGLEFLQNGGLNLNGSRPPLEPPATQRDLSYERQLTEKDAEIGQLKAEKYADAAVLAAERRLADKIAAIETSTAAKFAAQNEYNVANTAALASTKSQVAQLMSMTWTGINAPTILGSEAAASAFKVGGASAAASNG